MVDKKIKKFFEKVERKIDEQDDDGYEIFPLSKEVLVALMPLMLKSSFNLKLYDGSQHYRIIHYIRCSSL